MPKVLNTPANRQVCICPACPSYNDCAREKQEVLFCALEVGRGSCAYQMQGCVCGACPITRQDGLHGGYYCLRGAAEVVDKEAGA